jgi:hypothetical protein
LLGKGDFIAKGVVDFTVDGTSVHAPIQNDVDKNAIVN